jgi:hypothetical protein
MDSIFQDKIMNLLQCGKLLDEKRAFRHRGDAAAQQK